MNCVFCVFWLFWSLCQTTSWPYRLSHINALHINQFYWSKDQFIKFLKKIFRITFPSTFVTLFSKLECKQQTETRLFQIGIQSGLTNYPLLFDIRVSGLEGTTFSSSGAFGWLDGNLQATGVYPWHFFVLLSDRLLNFWQDSRTHRSCNALKNKRNISIITHLWQICLFLNGRP